MTNPPNWIQIAPLGNWPHPSGVMQVIDREALQNIVSNTQVPILVDQDHFSYDPAQSSEAFGWIVQLEARPDGGLFGRVEWTDLGADALTAGRFRRVSPVWLLHDLVPAGQDRIRPTRLDSVGLTNAPNIKAGDPVWNRGPQSALAFGAPIELAPARGATDRASLASKAWYTLANRHYTSDRLGWHNAWEKARTRNPAIAAIANRLPAPHSISCDLDVPAALREGALDPLDLVKLLP
jgi:hypothetical protein